MSVPQPLREFDIETVRFSMERELAAELAASIPGFAARRASAVPSDPKQIRRRLLADALRLTESMAPQAYGYAHAAQAVLGVAGDLEIYQSAGRENAALHLVEAPILLEVQGRMLSLLDPASAAALFGHELGHYLAHGPWTELGASLWVAQVLAQQGLLDASQTQAARRGVVAREITADRVGLLACQDLAGAVRLEMIATTGLSGDTLTWDTDAYLAQCQELMATTRQDGEQAHATSHPEHSLRTWAVWLFSQSDVYLGLTGGSGGRPLAEIDAEIAAVLTGPDLQLVEEDRAELPPFVYECALACSVLVAEADGEVSPQELAAIEDAFASRVPGWSEFLDPEVAHERFYQTGGLIKAGGADLARRLFLLISHVVGADDVVDGREVQMVIALGEALGFAREFRKWLQPAIDAMGVEIEADIEAPMSIALPARKAEVRDAMDALCQAVGRSGHTRISPRRLLRLTGADDEGAAKALEGIAGFFEQREIDVAPPLADVQLDDLVELSPRAGLVAAQAPHAELPADRKSLVDAITRLRDELISGDGRSPSVRLRKAEGSRRVFDLMRLEGVRKGTAERALTLVRAGETAVLVTPDDAGRHDASRECTEDLRMLDRLCRDQREETGANDLHLGYPMLLGSVGPADDKGPGYAVRGPLVLFPVDLVRDGRGARGFSLQPRDQEPVANQSLLRLLFNKANLALPDELGREFDALAAEAGHDVTKLVERLREVGVSIGVEGTTLCAFRERNEQLDGAARFLALEECALVGLFPQSSSELLQDYDALLEALEDPTADLATVLSAGYGLLPGALQQGEGPVVEGSEPGWPVLPSDPSQRAVAAACAKNLVTVVDGPPGTGKSQLIVNLVADAMRRGARVAVVAEKRAALDVVQQRLAGCGLAESIALVHDVGDDRKALFAQISARLKEFKPRRHNTTRMDVLRQEHGLASQTLEARRETLAHVADGLELSVGQLLALAAGEEQAGIAAASLTGLDRAQLQRLLELTERVHPHAALWGPGSWWRGQGERASLAEVGDDGLAQLQRSVAAAIEEGGGEQAVALRSDRPASASDLFAAAEGLTAVRGLLNLAATDARAAALVHAAWASPGATGLQELQSQWQANAQTMTVWSAPLAVVDAGIGRDVAVLRSFAGNIFRVFSPLWWRTRGAVRAVLPDLWPERAGAGFSASFLDELRGRIEAAKTWAATKATFAAMGCEALSPASVEDAQAALRTLETAQPQIASCAEHTEALGRLGIAIPESTEQLVALDALVAHREAQLEAEQRMRAHLEPWVSKMPWVQTLPFEDLATLRDRLRADGHRLRESDGWWQQLDAVFADARSVLDALATAASERSASEWREGLSRAWAQAHLTRLEAFLPHLADLGTKAAEQRASEAAERLARLESEIAEHEVKGICATLDTAELLAIPDAEYRARRTPKQKTKEALVKETSKSRRLMPLRQLVREFADDGVLDVLPCWLLSPETMAVLFPRAPLFDVVIFDEASQCTVESGLPVFLRAKQVVVAGDEKQMPPSSYFKLRGTGTEDADLSEAEVEARDMFAAESLLALARSRCAHAGLKWHYRCREEELIAFSNHAMYQGELLTIPSTSGPHGTPALRWISVEDGAYDSGLNRPEAARVVDLLAELLGRPKQPTVGVVTFNLKQRQTVLDLIDERMESDAAFAGLWQTASTVDALDERPFVKNLESVQGDERDIIIFSLGHAPARRQRRGGEGELYVPARFGPLGQRGGERRLNVAISRAKAECYVVSSFDPALLRVGNSTHSGPRLFKGYLDFAYALSNERFDVADRILDAVRGSPRSALAREATRSLVDGHVPLATQIMLALESTGLRCALDLGSSDFRIPLAVGHPDAEDGTFRVAVMTDEGFAGASAFEQFVHRPAVLRLRGWDVLHVDAATWSERSSDVVAAIVGRMGAAK